MKQRSATEPWREPVLGPCACSQLRRTARAVSTLYDEFLSAAGLTVTQYAVLVTIARAGAIQRTHLAAQLGMERTTLTRNLKPLERARLIAEKPSDDRREHLVSLTKVGNRRLDAGFRAWEKAQEVFLADFGQERFDELRRLLETASAVSKSADRSSQPR
jgi:DNA-binding MarR family transcriptional regulator